VKFAAIADWAERDGFPVKYMCEQLGVSVSGYYAWRGRPMSERAEVDAKLTALIEGIFSDKDGNVGRRRMVAELAARGHRVSIKRVHRLMSAAGLRGRHPRPWRKTTIAGHNTVPAPDLIGRDFTAAGPNQRWVGDITYVKTLDGWAYVATVIDLYSRMVVGWSVADHMRTDLVIEALEMAIKQRRPKKHVIFHSDRGTQGSTLPNNSRSTARRTRSDDHSGARESATTTPSPKASSPPTRRNSSTRNPGRESHTSRDRHSTGSRHTTTANGATRPCTT